MILLPISSSTIAVPRAERKHSVMAATAKALVTPISIYHISEPPCKIVVTTIAGNSNTAMPNKAFIDTREVLCVLPGVVVAACC